MTRNTRTVIARGMVLAGAMMIALASACSNATAPRYPQTDDDTAKKDTVKQGLVSPVTRSALG